MANTAPTPHILLQLEQSIILESALTSNMFIVSQILPTRFPSNDFAKVLSIWEVRNIRFLSLPPSLTTFFLQPMGDSTQLVAKSGIAYYMSQPHNVKEAFLDPIHTAVHIMFMPSACAPFPKRVTTAAGLCDHFLCRII